MKVPTSPSPAGGPLPRLSGSARRCVVGGRQAFRVQGDEDNTA